MVEDDFQSLYREIYRKELAEPKDPDDVERILSCIRLQHGIIDEYAETELESLPDLSQRKWRFIARSSRRTLAKFSQTYVVI